MIYIAMGTIVVGFIVLSRHWGSKERLSYLGVVKLQDSGGCTSYSVCEGTDTVG